MKPKYKLKLEAVPFFAEKYATACGDLDFWTNLNISWNALEKVGSSWIEYGKDMGLSFNASTLAGWESNDGQPIAHFHFTAYINDVKEDEFEIIENKHLRSLIDLFDRVLFEWNNDLKSSINEA